MTAALLVERVKDLGLLGYPELECEFIYDTMERLQPDFLCSWGTNVGHSDRIFWEAKQLLSLDTEMHSVDVVDQVPILRLEDAGKTRGHHVLGLDVTLHVGYGAQEAVSLYGGSLCAAPLFFSDDSHGESTILADLEMLARDVPEGVILVHDAMLRRANEPDRAIRRFLEAHDYDAVELWEGQGMVRLWPK